MSKKTFDFSRLLLLIGGLIGFRAFFLPFYQVDSLFAKTSGFEVVQSLWAIPSNILVTQIFAQTTTQLGWAVAFLMFLIPILFGIIAIEMFIRAVVLRFSIQHRAWLWVIFSLLGVIAGYAFSLQHEVDFQFFGSIKQGYWQSLLMVVISLFAKFSE